MRVNKSAIVAVAVAALGAAVLVGQFRPAAEVTGAAQNLPPYRIGYTSNDTTGLQVIRPGDRTENSLLGDAGTVDFDASGSGAGVAWVSNPTHQPGARRNDGQLFFRATDGGAPVALTNDGPVNQHPALSPDGTRVAFAKEQPNQPGVINIWIVNVDGGAPHQVTTDAARDTWPTWSPDGTQLAFSSTKDNPAGDIYTVPAAGGAETRITTDPSAAIEPAWSPDGTQIAFTTNRAHPAGDIALVRLADKGVALAIPNDQGDSAEPAWSPDGTRIAFSTHRNNAPFGAIHQVVLAGAAVSAVAVDARFGDTHPTWVRTLGEGGPLDRVVFTQLRPGQASNVFSADAAGNDRHDLTNNPASGTPAVSDSEPAFSLDGTALAYTEHSGEGQGRVMVADSDGANPHQLTTVDKGDESSPAWSPDGTMIALASGQSTGDEAVRHEVLIVTVADGRIVGRVPMPPQLQTDDTQPSWSPDGTRIALQRSATRIPPPVEHIDPATVNRPAAQGTSFSVTEIVHTTKVPASADITFLLDATGSEGDPITQLQHDIPGVIDGVHARDPQARFAIGSYSDPEDEPAEDTEDPDARFDLNVPPDGNPTAARLADELHNLYLTPVGDGLDPPKDWIYGLDQLAATVNFRPRSDRVVVLFGDSSSLDPNPPPGQAGHPTLAETITRLTAAGIRVVGVPITGFGDGLDSKGQASAVIKATGGVMLPPTDVTNPADLARLGERISAGIAGLSPAFEPVTITPTVTHCDTGLSLAFDPAGDETVKGGDDGKFTERVTLAASVPVGTTVNCTVEYRLNGEATVRAGYTETVAVRATDPRLPVIVVDSVNQNATSNSGAVVTYSATATDANGNPLTPSCDPASGSTFPIGVTTVTCTATDAHGNKATETALITVFPPDPTIPSIWTVTVATQPNGQVAVTKQLDLSVLFAEPCAGGPDGSPAWSPDGKFLAFSHNGICVANADDGGNAHRIAAPTPRQEGVTFTDPAWSPDGVLIAFTTSGEGPSIWTVPVAGGATTELIDTPGGAKQPAFQRQPDLVVTATADPAAIPFAARTTLTFTVNNHGTVPASNVHLALTLPNGLRPEQITTDTGDCPPATMLCSLGALAAGKTATVHVVATGVEAGPQVVRAAATSDLPSANPAGTVATVTVTVGPSTGHLTLLTGVAPNPAFVGGDDIVVSYTVHNAGTAVMPAVKLTTTLPAVLGAPKSVTPPACRANGTGCDLGSLLPGQTVEIRYVLGATTAVNATETGTLTTAGPDTSTVDHTASAPVVVTQPVLQLNPPVGPQGFVTEAKGAGFPPGAKVTLTWSPGITALPNQVTVAADGTIDTQVLIFYHDQLGLRTLGAASTAGVRFGTVTSPPFLVVPRGSGPPLFGGAN